jgi:beta-hydroxylase
MSTPNAQPALRRMIIQSGKHTLRKVGDFQARHSLVETGPVLPKEQFPWTRELEAHYADIRADLQAVLSRPEDIPAFHQLSPDQKRISKGDHWKTFAFYVFRHRVDDNCVRCPTTARLLDALPDLQNAWFSILAPHYHIPAHKGPTKAIIRCHLPLMVPKDSENCWLRVDDQICHWREGECLVFDDTYEHEVYNNTDETRVVLFLDFDRPMDRVGSLFNRALIRIIRASAYVKDPLKNLAAWNAGKRPDN